MVVAGCRSLANWAILKDYIISMTASLALESIPSFMFPRGFHRGMIVAMDLVPSNLRPICGILTDVVSLAFPLT